MFLAKKVFLSAVLVLLTSSLFLGGQSSAIIHQVSMIDNAFIPATDTVTVGDTVRWTNNGVFTHTSTSNTGVWDSGFLNPGQSYMRQFGTAGSYPYHCSLHLGMNGTIIVLEASSVDDENSVNSIQTYSLKQNFPNPFNATTQISYYLQKRGKVVLKVYNLLGQEVKSLVAREEDPGLKTLTWDGTDDRGLYVPSGIYFYRLSAPGFAVTKRMVFLK